MEKSASCVVVSRAGRQSKSPGRDDSGEALKGACAHIGFYGDYVGIVP